MVRVIMDVITRGLREASQNLAIADDLITKGIAARTNRWYANSYLPIVEDVIKTGRPMNKIPRNVGRYREWKVARYGIDHGLGVLSGKLLLGVITAPHRITVTRGKEVRFVVIYKDPYYIAYVHDGFTAKGFAQGTVVRPRPFVEVARDKSLPVLKRRLESMFDGLDFTRPTPELVSSVIATTT